jgi:mycothiol synthase
VALKTRLRQHAPDWLLQWGYAVGMRLRPALARRSPLVMCFQESGIRQSKPVLPAGCTLTNIAAPEAPAEWIDTLVSAGIGVSADTWRADFTADPQTFVAGILCDGQLVGVSSLTRMPCRQPPAGLVTWVGIRREQQGKRLAGALISSCLDAAHARGLATVFLLTDDHRLAAIRTYLRGGFRPCLSSWDWTHLARWKRLHAQMRLPFSPCRDATHAASGGTVTVS